MTTQPLPDAICAALAPFAPPGSSVHLPGSDNAQFGGRTYYRQADADAARAHQARAEKFDMQWAPAMRLGGWL